MATNLSNVTFSNVYKDDFADSDNFHRILFNSGKALQARELTQMQTIIQKEIERFGSNIFRQGGAVTGGGLTIDNKVEFVNLATNQLPSTPSTLVGKYYKDSTNNLIIRIKEVLVANASTSDIAIGGGSAVNHNVDTLIVEYVSTSSGTAGSAPVRLQASNMLQRIVAANDSTLFNDAVNYPDMALTAGHPSTGQNISGLGLKANIDKGSFFVQGHFVFCKAQTVIVQRFSPIPNTVLGFQIAEQVINTDDDTSLFDNQGSAPNLSSPGADRYRIQLTLTTKVLAGSNNFIYLANIVNGKLSDEINLDNSYKQLQEVLALRTKEESGNYIVKRFDLNPSSITSTKVNYNISDGIAYVDGYRLDLDAKSVEVDRPTTTQEVDGELISTNLGNYVVVAGDHSSDSASLENNNIPDISNFQKLNLYAAFSAGQGTAGGNTADHAALVIGSARCRGLYRETTGRYRMHLFDVRMKVGQSFSFVRSIGRDQTNFMNVVLEGDQAVLKNTINNDLLFSLPKNRPQFDGITGSSMIVQRKFTFTTSSAATSISGTNGGGLPAGCDAFFGGSSWVVSEVGEGIVEGAVCSVEAGNVTFSVTGLPSGSKTFNVLAQVQMSGSTSVAERTKTLKETTITRGATSDSDGRGFKFISLDKPDIFAIKSVKETDSNGVDISGNFELDNGQRDNYYGIGRLLPKKNVDMPAANVFVRYQYFEHEASVTGVGGQKCYFSATSYKNNSNAVGSLDGTGVTYETIPDYTKGNGQKVNLRDVLDFRPVGVLQHDFDSAGDTLKANGHHNITFDSNGPDVAGTVPLIHLLPQPGGTVQANVTYFLGRKDRLVASSSNLRGGRSATGSVDYIQGLPSFDPELPNLPNGAMPLYNINLGGNTINTKDITTEPYANKRFQMADIARLERRIDNLDEVTSLSLLELNTSTLNVVDSAGNSRVKSGFLVDNFRDYSFTDITNNQQRASIDPQAGYLTPLVISKVNRLLYDSDDAQSNAALRGDNLYLSMSDSAVEYINQNLATTTENINPFAVIRSNGHIELSPSTDTWVETQFAAAEVNGGGTVTQTVPTQIQFGSLASFRDNWIGQPTSWNVGETSVAATGRRRDFSRTNTRSVTISGGFDTVTTQVGERVLSVSILPFMRSIKVYFRAQGLRRKTRHFPYFGNSSIDNFTRQESFARYSTRTDAGAVSAGATAHPDGSTNLTSDSNGTITGSFIIPSNNTLQFNTGTQQFKLLDISGGIDSNSISSANTSFTSAGTLETRQRIFTSTRVERVQTIIEENTQSWTNWVDPLAQSFLVDPIDNPNGVFITKVKIYFATKDDNHGVPVQCQIRPMENGVPVNQPLPQAVKFVEPANVNATALSGATMGGVQGAGTDFKFDEPIYLAPGEEYAIVLLAESTAYTVYVAETYEFVVGTTAQRIAKQPTLGSLFLSQNGSTWTPEQSKDLMFTLFRADFNTSSSAILNNATPSTEKLATNPMQTTSGNNNIRVFHTGHGFNTGDKVTISGVTDAIATVSASLINGNRTISEVDHTGYTFTVGSNPNANVRGGGANVVVTANTVLNTFLPQIRNLQIRNTSITAQAKLTLGRSFGGAPNSLGSQTSRTNGSHGYSKEANFSDIILNEFNYTDMSRYILTDSNAAPAQHLSGAKSATIKLNLATNDTKVSPVIDLQRANLVGFENLIDKQHSSNNATLGVKPILTSFTDEIEPTDGTHAAKHLTRPVNLEESAVGLKILFAANRPAACEFKVYFRTATSDEDLSTQAFILQPEFSNNPADDDNQTFREYEYLPGGQIGNLDAFTKFQIKIVMRSTNQSKIPTLKDLRVIAMVT
tara:strand:- start:600 stop:6071 length:5472 start_codon:yes stop_codon:yes gene_type:complete